jgi:selenide, water dikinase
VDPAQLRTKERARAGDVLVLTKPLGTGLIANAIQYGDLTDEQASHAIRSMEQLNAVGSDVFTKHAIQATTDVTGFGLVGHALTFAEGSKVGFTIRLNDLPLLDHALDLAAEPLGGGSKANEDNSAPLVDRAAGLDERRGRLAFAAQTSGGLLAAVPRDKVDAVLRDLQAAGALAWSVIGEVTATGVGRVRLV